MSKNILGIDIAKLKFDAALIFENKIFVKQFDNSPKGFKSLAKWLKSLEISELHACLEATGTYGDGVARFLYEQGQAVSVVNPLSIKGYAASKMQRNKTDTADARLIADFCLTQHPRLWSPPSEQIVELQALTRRIEVLQKMRQAEKNRLEVAPAKTRPSLERMIETFDNEIKALTKSIKEHINEHPNLKEPAKLLRSIPGIGEKTAQLLLSEIEFERYESAREVAAYAGVTPKKKESGTSVKQTGLSKLGNGKIRKGLYFPAVVARRKNKMIGEFAARLEKNGKTPMQIICAAMRKLLHQAFGVLKNKTVFNPNMAFSG